MRLTLNQTQLMIELEWYEQLWAFTLHNPIQIPLDHIVRATTEEPQSNWTDIRAPGTYLPGVMKAGTYYTKQGREFWYVTQDKQYLVLELRDEPYQKIVLSLAQHLDWAERLNQETPGFSYGT